MDDLTLAKIRQGEFWEQFWERSNQQRRKRIDEQESSIAMWNRRADSFARNTVNKNNEIRREAVFKFLKDCGVELTGARILDVGAGPGNYTLPMAKEAEHVVVLDPAVSMLNILKDKVEQEGLTNITYSSEPWEEVDLDRFGWRGKFDLVFASMSPGVRDAVTLKRLMEASRGYCYVSKFAGPRHNSLQRKIWSKLFKQSRDDHSAELLLPWNLLYAWGYYPNTRFMAARWVNEEPISAMEQRMVDWFMGFEGLPANHREIIREVLEQEAINGLVREEVHTTTGMMVWRV